MYVDRTDDLLQEIYNFKIIHGGLIHLIPDNLRRAPIISKDIRVIPVTNYKTFPILRQYENFPDNISLTPLFLENFQCWVDKIKPILEFIKTIPEKYILYVDSTDTILVNDILNPEQILETYKCKVLFNAEEGYSYPGHPCDKKEWLYEGYYLHKSKIDQINMNRLLNRCNTAPYVKSLNAGVYLGEREFLIVCLERILDLMLDSPIKGYPYGESDDQILWQYVMAEFENGQIQIDYNNLYFLWGGDAKLKFLPDHWEHFNYFNKQNKSLFI